MAADSEVFDRRMQKALRDQGIEREFYKGLYLWHSNIGMGVLKRIAPSAGQSRTQALQCQHSSG